MERPKIKDYFAEKANITTVHNEYINSPHLYSYASNLDRYVDYLEDKLSERVNKNEPLESNEPKALIIADVVKSLPQDNFCEVCNLPTDGEKCYSKRCPV
jgi:hypothetical protein